MADVFESDIASVAIGSRAYLMFPYEGTKPFGANVTYIQPRVDPMTRTVKVRLEAPNPGLRLKPYIFVNVVGTKRRHEDHGYVRRQLSKRLDEPQIGAVWKLEIKQD